MQIFYPLDKMILPGEERVSLFVSANEFEGKDPDPEITLYAKPFGYYLHEEKKAIYFAPHYTDVNYNEYFPSEVSPFENHQISFINFKDLNDYFRKYHSDMAIPVELTLLMFVEPQ